MKTFEDVQTWRGLAIRLPASGRLRVTAEAAQDRVRVAVRRA